MIHNYAERERGARVRVLAAFQVLLVDSDVPLPEAVATQSGEPAERNLFHLEAVADVLDGLALEAIQKGLYRDLHAVGLASVSALRAVTDDDLKDAGLSKTVINKIRKALAVDIPFEVADEDEDEGAAPANIVEMFEGSGDMLADLTDDDK